MSHTVAVRAVLLSVGMLWAAVCCDPAPVGAEDKPAKAEPDPSRETLDRIVKGFELLGTDGKRFDMQAEPVLRWPNSTRDTHEGATFVWARDGRPEAVACVWENGGSWAYAFHSLSDKKLVGRHNGRTFWQTEKPGIELTTFPDAPEPADSAVKRLAQMKELARRFKCRLSEINRKTEELRLLPRPIFRYETSRKDLIDGALFAYVQGTDPEVVLVLEAASRDGKSEWRYALTRRTGYAVEADLDSKPHWSVSAGGGASNAAWVMGGLGRLN